MKLVHCDRCKGTGRHYVRVSVHPQHKRAYERTQSYYCPYCLGRGSWLVEEGRLEIGPGSTKVEGRVPAEAISEALQLAEALR